MDDFKVVSAVRVHLGHFVQNCVNRSLLYVSSNKSIWYKLHYLALTFLKKIEFLDHCTRDKEYVSNYFVTFYDRDRNNPCLTSFTTTLIMRREHVYFGSKVGNSTNPRFLEFDSWVLFSIIKLITLILLQSLFMVFISNM